MLEEWQAVFPECFDSLSRGFNKVKKGKQEKLELHHFKPYHATKKSLYTQVMTS